MLVTHLAIEEGHSAVVGDIPVHDRHSYIAKDAPTLWVGKKSGKHLPAVEQCVRLIEVVLRSFCYKAGVDNMMTLTWQLYPHISSSGPLLYLAPASLANLMLLDAVF